MPLTLNNEARTIESADITPFTIEIVASYVARSRVPMSDLPRLIETTHAAVAATVIAKPVLEDKPKLVPAVPISKSVHHDYIVCLEDGRKLKTMRRYLRLKYKLTPEAYREKWGLPDDYSMTCPEYAARRSKYAQETGLGRGGHKRVQPERKR